MQLRDEATKYASQFGCVDIIEIERKREAFLEGARWMMLEITGIAAEEELPWSIIKRFREYFSQQGEENETSYNNHTHNKAPNCS
jgi:hypothetical protein